MFLLTRKPAYEVRERACAGNLVLAMRALWFCGWSCVAALGAVSAGNVAQSPPDVTFNQRIGPLMHRKCGACHQPSGSAPFPLLTYTDLKKRLELVRIQALMGAMPPCPIASDFAEFCLTSPLDEREILDLQRWIQAGAPEGIGVAPTFVQPPAFASEPDAIVSSPKNTPMTPAEGPRYWRVIEVAAPAQGGELIGIELVPNASIALRSAQIALAPPTWVKTHAPFSKSAGSMNVAARYLIGGWAPGYRAWRAPSGAAFHVPPGATFLVQAHYQPSGKPEDGGFKLKLHWRKAKPVGELKWLSLVKPEPFVIEANTAPTYSMVTTLQSAASVVAVWPEARFYGSRIQVLVTEPGKPERTLFESYRWDPYWVGNFAPSRPIPLAKNTRIEARFVYANDANCFMNQNKTPKPVKSGPNVDNEVCRMHIQLWVNPK